MGMGEGLKGRGEGGRGKGLWIGKGYGEGIRVVGGWARWKLRITRVKKVLSLLTVHRTCRLHLRN